VLTITLLFAKHLRGDIIKDDGKGETCIHVSRKERRESIQDSGGDICGEATNLKIQLRQ